MLAEIATHGPERLKPIFEALGEKITYEELHIIRMLALCLGANLRQYSQRIDDRRGD